MTKIQSFGVQFFLLFNLYDNSKSDSSLATQITNFESEINNSTDEFDHDYPTLESKIESLEQEIDTLDYSLNPWLEDSSDKCGKY